MTSDQKQNKALCRFEETKKPITVGDVFEMSCEWPFHLAILSSPVRIEFQSKPPVSLDQKEIAISPYSLVILQTKNILPGKAVFKVTSYKAGVYNTGFHLLSDKGVIEAQALSWKVESVLPVGKSVKPYPPYGPWTKPLPFWYGPACLLILIGFLVFAFLKIRLFIKRKKQIKKVQERIQNNDPYDECIGQLNLLTREIDKKSSIIVEVEKTFRLFLENKFFIYALNEPPIKVIQQLKKYNPSVYQKHKQKILNFWTELNRLSQEKAKSKDLEQIIDMARRVVLDLQGT